MVRAIAATPETFDALVMAPRGELVVVDFWGHDCPNCEAFAAVLPELLAELGDAALQLVQVDAYTYAELATRFGLHGVPTFVLVRDGRVIGRMTGYKGKDFWLGVVRDHL